MSEEKVLNLLNKSQHPMTIEEIADQLHLSIRTARRALSSLERKALVKITTLGNKKLYQPVLYHNLEKFMKAEVTGIPLTTLEDIAERYKRLKIDTKIQIRCKDYVRNTKPQELKKELIDFLKERIDALSRNKNEENQRKINRLKKDLALLEGMEWIGNISPIREEALPEDNFTITGSDASRDFLDMVWQCDFIPIIIRASIIACVGVPFKYTNGEPEYGRMIRRPEIPLAAGGMFLEELSTRYPNLDETQRNILSLILMNTAHFEFDREIIVKLKPNIHFHDGRLLPPHMHFMDFYYEWRRDALWRCFSSALDLKSNAERMKCEIVGVVKEPHGETTVFSKILAMLLEKEANIKYGTYPIEEFGAAKLFLDERTASWVIKVKPSKIYLPADAESSARTVLKEDFERYLNHLKQSDYAFFLCRHRNGGIVRYDFYSYNGENSIIRRDNVASYADFIAESLIGKQWRPERYLVSVPSVVAIADNESKNWVKTVANIIARYLKTKLLGG